MCVCMYVCMHVRMPECMYLWAFLPCKLLDDKAFLPCYMASELSQRQEAKPPGKTSELSQGRSQKHQERHQSYAKTQEADIKSSMKNTSIKASRSSPKILLLHCSGVDVKRRMRNTNIKSSNSSPKVLSSHCSRVDVKMGMRNTNIKSSKSRHDVLCHTEKKHTCSRRPLHV